MTAGIDPGQGGFWFVVLCWLAENIVHLAHYGFLAGDWSLLKGLIMGLVAVTIYDMSRLPFVLSGMWADFIPKIGNYLLNREDVHWSVGYVWRYLGNGGGMGMAFYMVAPLVKKSWNRIAMGLVYGVSIFACLVATIYLSPDGTKYLFEPSTLSFCVGLVGHVIFGSVLGKLAHLSKRHNCVF